MDIRPYGDAPDDGLVQVSFTLPLAASERARAAALELALKMGLQRPQIVHLKPIGDSFSFFVLYGALEHSVDPETLEVEEQEFPLLAPAEINRVIREQLRRQMVVLGASTGTDAHTVGLDAILSFKGFAGDKGLESYSEMRVVNLGSQVSAQDLAARAIAERADAVLVSQIVTQREAHLRHLSEVREALIATGVRDKVVLVGGGPRLVPAQSIELGYDRIFGRGAKPSEVASFLAWKIASHDRSAA
ncbi:MAG TPA: OAM dimerization domain-containing protein [Actinomycetota bacterium]|nr:OAM dimerization domain-containing protein [Actinomycetota bacterium]